MIPVPEFRVNIVTKLQSRIAEGKYLKVFYDLHDRCGTVNVDIERIGPHDESDLRLEAVMGRRGLC